MVKTFKKLKNFFDIKFLSRAKNPFVIASFFCAILIYFKILPVKQRNPFKSVFELEKISFVEGKIYSNPTILSSKKYYSCDLELKFCGIYLNENFCKSNASGIVKLFIPSQILEANYPGKLYSISDGTIFFENDENISCKVRYSEKIGGFYVEKAKYLGYEQNFFGKIKHFRAICRIVFKRILYSWGNAGGLILSLLSGSREYLENGLDVFFRTAGISHILALSGMHLSFFSALSSGFSKKLFGEKFSLIGKFFGIIFFVFFAGISPSLFRALICSFLMLFATMVFCVNIDFFIILCISFLIHCAVFPSHIFSTAFILSYAALGGILLFSDSIRYLLKVFIPPKINSSLSASMGAQFATTGISIKLFGQIMPIGILSTLVISPMISNFLTLSLIGIILSLIFPVFSKSFGIILNLLYKCIIALVKIFALVPPIDF